MKVIASTLNGINKLKLGDELERAVKAGINIIQFEISSGIDFELGPFGEFMIANIAGWTNLCMAVQLTDSAKPKLIENIVACDTDIVILPARLLSKENGNLIKELNVISSAMCNIENQIEFLQCLNQDVDMVYLNYEKNKTTQKDWEDKMIFCINGIERKIPGKIIAGKLYPDIEFTPKTIEILKVFDFCTIDFFNSEDTSNKIETIFKYSKKDINPVLAKALPNGLKIKRNKELKKTIFNSLDAQSPPDRRQ